MRSSSLLFVMSQCCLAVAAADFMGASLAADGHCLEKGYSCARVPRDRNLCCDGLVCDRSGPPKCEPPSAPLAAEGQCLKKGYSCARVPRDRNLCCDGLVCDRSGPPKCEPPTKADSASGAIYALNQTETKGTFRLVTIDLTTGTKTAVSKTGADFHFIPGASAVNINTGILYFIGAANSTWPTPTPETVSLVGVDTKTGAVVSTITLPILFPDDELFSADVIFTKELGLVLTLAYDKQHVLGTLNPTTGAWFTITTFSATILPGQSLIPRTAYAPDLNGGTFVVQLADGAQLTHFSYNVKSNTTTNATSAQFTDFLFNPVDGMVWGHGLTVANKTFVRTLCKMDPATLAVTQVKVLDTLSVDAGYAVTIKADAHSASMFWISSLFKNKDSGPYYLVQVSLNAPGSGVPAGTVISQAEVCAIWNFAENPGDCPATLDFVM